jgi:hypothetical protein
MITREVEQRWRSFLQQQFASGNDFPPNTVSAGANSQWNVDAIIEARETLSNVPVFTTLPSSELEYPCVVVKAYDVVESFTQDAVTEMLVDVSILGIAESNDEWHLEHKARVEALMTILDEPTYFGGYWVFIDTVAQSFREIVLAGVTYFNVDSVSSDIEGNLAKDTMTFKMAIGPGVLSGEGGYSWRTRLRNFSFRHKIEDLFTRYFLGQLTPFVKERWEVVPAYYGGALPPNRIVTRFAKATRDRQLGYFFAGGQRVAIYKKYRPYKDAVLTFQIVSDRQNLSEEDHFQGATEMKNLVLNSELLAQYAENDLTSDLSLLLPAKNLMVIGKLSEGYSESQSLTQTHLSDMIQVFPDFAAVTTG